MTDDSDLDDDSVAQHKLSWRSESKFVYAHVRTHTFHQALVHFRVE